MCRTRLHNSRLLVESSDRRRGSISDESRHEGIGRGANGVVVVEYLVLADEVGVKIRHDQVVRLFLAARPHVADCAGPIKSVKLHSRLQLASLDPAFAGDPERMPAAGLNGFVANVDHNQVTCRANCRSQHGLVGQLAGLHVL